MDKSGDITQHRKKDVDPEVHAESHLEKYAYRRDDNRKNDADDVSHSMIFRLSTTGISAFYSKIMCNTIRRKRS